uniref:Uncharacterized protein n=1 Tax=Tetraselmis sp. GSL018 TaxID=582737 RepID=A0A061SML5_9CHLO|mmetsp:Transcript_41252/g.97873  ORF Transcript_41252/g.97873 Transcript_41252/m.97873 type:complete len:255 (+) Transcript_41252:209-973(+)|eukprot:CAMPEP_0177580034 /NCGR_PEP_ID=MMETSP0419_2-20121207/1319_1 /TAXON_ID=582737 /ORGANISM="Tetraselmis sp., Strain GSL018" /LENGTH=254 /DNA_ID=CAMNT_0019068823 /DNA_START=523 /DNA_END=1287 /DNA_ORIENTATION=-
MSSSSSVWFEMHSVFDAQDGRGISVCLSCAASPITNPAKVICDSCEDDGRYEIVPAFKMSPQCNVSNMSVWTQNVSGDMPYPKRIVIRHYGMGADGYWRCLVVQVSGDNIVSIREDNDDVMVLADTNERRIWSAKLKWLDNLKGFISNGSLAEFTGRFEFWTFSYRNLLADVTLRTQARADNTLQSINEQVQGQRSRVDECNQMLEANYAAAFTRFTESENAITHLRNLVQAQSNELNSLLMRLERLENRVNLN